MFGNKYLIPCDPVDYLNKEYGNITFWSTPKKSNYTWTNLSKTHSLWNKCDWPHAIRFYHKNGTIDKKYTIRYVNAYGKMKLKDFPSQRDYEKCINEITNQQLVTTKS